MHLNQLVKNKKTRIVNSTITIRVSKSEHWLTPNADSVLSVADKSLVFQYRLGNTHFQST